MGCASEYYEKLLVARLQDKKDLENHSPINQIFHLTGRLHFYYLSPHSGLIVYPMWLSVFLNAVDEGKSC